MKLTTLLSIAAAVCVATAAPAPKPSKKDPCAIVATAATSATADLPFDAVAACYRNIPYNAKVADDLLTTLRQMTNDYYVFEDSANGRYKAPFNTPRVNFDVELAKIRSTKWKNDYDFNMALSNLFSSANDGHLSYKSNCYMTASFSQPLALYAPVVKGKQSIRVFSVDTTNANAPKDNLVDCEVQTIDGQPAIKAIQDYTDKYSGISKDPGVRLNDALASTFWTDSTSWTTSGGGWMTRLDVPAKSSMEYTIKCAKGGVKKYKIPWRVRPSRRMNLHNFKDTPGYWRANCAAFEQPPNRVVDRNNRDDNEAPARTFFKERGTLPQPRGPRNGPSDAPPESPITLANEIITTTTTAFYRMKKGDACVAVIATESAGSQAEYWDFIDGLKRLRDSGCKKLIFDMTNNGGGSIDFATFVNALFFPKAKPYFDMDLRASSMAKQASKASLKFSPGMSIFDGRGYNSTRNGLAFKDDSMFTKSIRQTRNNKTNDYTQRSFFGYSWKMLPLAKNDSLPWKAKDMAIVTNGWCGSACTQIATRFATTQGVKTYSIGGIQNRPMSYYSFPGGFVYQHMYLVDEFSMVNMKGKNVPKSLPVQGIASYAMGQIYADGEKSVPLEYDTKHFAAKVKLDFDPATARHPDLVWQKIADDFKK
ncbi:hypothetical protein DFQ27_004749 [Actinomortierella ambigua]|uniref:Tail specific protease domain-containing protein n=1 Tax=Actinomortierella ambigua TaxID=1343610 RepID=A0A9P6Q0Z1_9FUNG|nr:hypothetical protein DFQ27_004749 [Actinomortierella ambigua]